jgi:hypothetical protein
VTNIPDAFRPLVTELGVGDVLEVKDLEVPPGVIIKHDPDERIATVRVVAEEFEAEEGAEEGEAQPEVITRAKEEGGSDAESKS